MKKQNRIAQGVIFKAITIFCDISERLLLIPVFIAYWGEGEYANWAVLYSLAMMLAVLDFGLTPYASNRIRCLADGSVGIAWHAVYRTSVRIVTALALISATCVWLVVDGSLMQGYGADSIGQEKANAVLLLLSFAVLGSLSRNAAAARFRAEGDYPLHLGHAAAVRLAQFLALAVTVFVGGGVVAAALAFFLAHIIVGYLGQEILQRVRYSKFPKGTVEPIRIFIQDGGTIAGAYFVRQLGRVASQQAPTILLGALSAGNSLIVQFVVARAIIGVVRQFTTQIADVVGLDVSESWFKGEIDGCRQSVRRASGILGLFVGGSLGLLMVFGRDFVQLWTSGEVYFDWYISVWLAMSVLLGGAALPSTSFLHFTNSAKPLAIAFAVKLGIIIAIGPLLVLSFDAAGAAFLVFLVDGIAGAILIIRKAAEKLNKRQILLWREYLGPAFTAGLVAVLVGSQLNGDMAGDWSVLIFRVTAAGAVTFLLLACIVRFVNIINRTRVM